MPQSARRLSPLPSVPGHPVEATLSPCRCAASQRVSVWISAANPLTFLLRGIPGSRTQLPTMPVFPVGYPVARLMWFGAVIEGLTGTRASATCPSRKKRANPPAASCPSR